MEDDEIENPKTPAKGTSHWAIEQVLRIHHLNIIPEGAFYGCFKLGDFMTAAVQVI